MKVLWDPVEHYVSFCLEFLVIILFGLIILGSSLSLALVHKFRTRFIVLLTP